MSSLAVLVGRDGHPQISVQVLCDGVPMRALSQVDPATNTPNLRFLAPSPGGRITMRVQNGGVKDGSFIQLERGELGPQDTWDSLEDEDDLDDDLDDNSDDNMWVTTDSDADSDDDFYAGDRKKTVPNIVNRCNVLWHGDSLTVSRDESTGGRAILVEPLRDAKGRALSAEDAELRRVRRTKWRLRAWPRRVSAMERIIILSDGFMRMRPAETLTDSEWRLLDAKLGLKELPLRVVTPNSDCLMAVSPTVSIESLKERVERELGIPLEEQRLCTEDGSSPLRMSDVLRNDSFPTLYVRGKERGERLWFFVQHQKSKKFVVAKARDTVHDVRWCLGRYPELEFLSLHGKELPDDCTLSECSDLSFLDTLEIHERGSLRVAVTVEAVAVKPPVKIEVEVGIDPQDSVRLLCQRAADRVSRDARLGRRRRLWFDLTSAVFRLGAEEMSEDSLARSVAEVGITTDTAPTPALSLLITAPERMQIFVRNLLGVSKTFVVSTCESIKNLKAMIESREGIAIHNQRLVVAGKQLEDERTLPDYNIQDGATVHLTSRLRGGGEGPKVTTQGLVAEAAAGAVADPEGAQPVPAPPTTTHKPAGALAVGKVFSGAVVAAPRTVGRQFEVNYCESCPMLQFDVFVDMQ